MPENSASRDHLVVLSGMIDRAIAFSDTGDQVLLGAMLSQCQDCARIALNGPVPLVQ